MAAAIVSVMTGIPVRRAKVGILLVADRSFQ
jgi:hypothetical protein